MGFGSPPSVPANKRGLLPLERIRALEALPGWSWNVRKDAFGRSLGLLQGYVRREGHARVPTFHVERGFELGRWVVKERRDYKQGRLSGDQIESLEALPGWAWAASRRHGWFEKGLSSLKRYVAREGHARVPRSHWEGGLWLGDWVSSRRKDHALGRLTREQSDALEALPGWTWPTRSPRPRP